MTQANGNHGAVDRPVSSPRGTPVAGPSPSTADIPDKLYFRIGEVARLCAVQAYVLRFWETEFPQLHPNKGGTGQRLFRRRDVEMAMRIRRLLYEQGYTIPGARQLLKTEARLASAPEQPAPSSARERLAAVHQGLRELQALLARPAGAALSDEPPGIPPPPARRPRSAAFRRFRQDRGASLFDPPPKLPGSEPLDPRALPSD